MLKYNIEPSDQCDFELSVGEILHKVKDLDNLVKLSFFVDVTSARELIRKKAIIAGMCRDILIKEKTTIVVLGQKSLDAPLIAEYCVYEGGGLLYHKHHKGFDYLLIEEGKQRHLFLNGIEADNKTALQEQAEEVFLMMSEILHKNNFPLNAIVRQWNYIPSILWVKDDVQNYQVFNDVRSLEYNKVKWHSGYPAATGIGVMGHQLTVDCIATQGNLTQPITNPKQIDAHIYSAEVLEGLCATKTTPKFERAQLLTNSEEQMLFISGTAAINGEQSDISDIVSQTQLTLDHIAALYGAAKGRMANDKAGIWLLRVYIKNEIDSAVAKEICRAAYPDAAIMCVKADVCRPELLIEIEAFASSAMN